MKNRPKVIINVACSLDGIIASERGPLEFSNEEDWKRVHTLRNTVDAILVGINTIIKDNPSLRIKKVKATKPFPYRIVLDSTGKIPLSAKILSQQELYPTIIFTSSCLKEKEEKLRKTGAYVERVSIDSESKYLVLEEILEILSNKFRIQSVMVEGGANVIFSFIKRKLVDKMNIFYAPVFVGSEGGVSLFPMKTVDDIEDAYNFKIISSRQIGDGILLEMKCVEKRVGNES
ncbi:MAG: RibD family protein [Candidatus Heimdallarchaeaceae archaeon]